MLLKEACEDEEKPKMWREAVAETKEKLKGVNLRPPKVEMPSVEEKIKPFYEIGGAR